MFSLKNIKNVIKHYFGELIPFKGLGQMKQFRNSVTKHPDGRHITYIAPSYNSKLATVAFKQSHFHAVFVLY